MRRLGEERYNLMLNNCEHFAVWCKTGQHRSSQVDRALGFGQMLLEQGLNIKQELSEQTFATQLEAVEKLRSHLQELLKGKPKPE